MNWKSEIKWFTISSFLALVVAWFLLSKFQNYNWALSFQYSDVLWSLSLVFYFFSLIAGLIYFVRFLVNGRKNRLIKVFSITFLSLGLLCFSRASWILKNLDAFLAPTSEKTEFGFTIYPPLSYSSEQLQQLNKLKELKYVTDGIWILLALILFVFLLTILKRNKKIFNNGRNS